MDMLDSANEWMSDPANMLAIVALLIFSFGWSVVSQLSRIIDILSDK